MTNTAHTHTHTERIMNICVSMFFKIYDIVLMDLHEN